MTIVVTTNIVLRMVTKLQKELKQTKPFANPEEEVYLSVLRTAEWLSRGVNETLRQADLTPTQYNALRILRGAGEPGASCSDISERMVTKDSDITRLLDRLEARGLIYRERESKDRRRVATRITDEGLKVLAELDGPIAQCHRSQLRHLGEEQLASLSRLLEAARNGSE